MYPLGELSFFLYALVGIIISKSVLSWYLLFMLFPNYDFGLRAVKKDHRMLHGLHLRATSQEQLVNFQ